MRVGILSPFPLDPKIIFGGLESVTYNQLMCLKNKDINIDVISLNRDISSEKTLIFSKRIKIHYIPQSKYPNIVSWFLFDRKKTIKKIKELNADIINIQGNIVMSYCICKKFKSILTIHGIGFREYHINRNIFMSALKKILHFPFFKESLRNCTAIITNSEYTTKFINRYTKKKIYSINNPTQQAYFDSENNGSEKNQLLFVGSISPRKSIHHLILALPDVIKKHKHIKLNIVGKITDEKYFKHLQSIISVNKLEKYILFLGSVSEQKKLYQYENSTILILPSLEETAPVVITEAMAVGIPVIGSNRAGIPYMIKDNETGLIFEYGNSKMLAEKILNLLNDRNRLIKMGVLAKKNAIEMWHPKVIGDKLFNLYNQINNL